MRMKEKIRSLKEKIDVQTRDTGIAQVNSQTVGYDVINR